MTLFFLIIGSLILLMFLLTVIFGAPYVPTHKKVINDAFDLVNLNPGDLILELGSGDGRLLIEASKRNFKAIGFEINPVLFIICWLRIRPHKSNLKVKFGDYKHYQWPTETKAIYIFGIHREMKFLSKRLVNYPKSIKVVSYAFDLPGFKAKTVKNGMILYEINSKN